ncbi:MULTISPECIES: D-2-hydroxyacid dehydrogenase [Priestia]|nr:MULTISPECIES: D-2-hydroxyacid dehydrogenase [Priestia]SCC56424.1 Phosphoglycerate dehydrogenase [Priestia flexa]
MEIQNILVTSRMYKELEGIIEREDKRGKTFRYVDEKNINDEDLKWADAYMSFYPVENFAFHQMKWVHSLGAGVDRYVKLDSWKDDVILTRTVCSFGARMSEYCLSYMLSELQYHVAFQKAQREKKWEPLEPVLLSSQKVVIYGTGEIGQSIAEMLKRFGVQVTGVSRSGKSNQHFHQVVATGDEASHVKQADWIINTLPLTPETNRMFNAEWMNILQGAYFINVGRGATVDTVSLIEAINTRRIKKAFLDVFEVEPLPQSDMLWEHENIVITPHISAVTTPKEAVACFFDTLDRIEADKPLENKVDLNRGY